MAAEMAAAKEAATVVAMGVVMVEETAGRRRRWRGRRW